MAVVLLPFIILSVVGLVLSSWAHVVAIMGFPQPLGTWTGVLHLGVFVVWFPAVFVSTRMTRGYDRSNYWQMALRGCPTWLRWLTFGFFGYAIVNFVLSGMGSREGKVGGRLALFEAAPTSVWRGVSGHWMAFYAAALAILYSAAVIFVKERIGKRAGKKPGDELDELIA